jgi:DNA-binding MarR family transcriptional regulator
VEPVERLDALTGDLYAFTCFLQLLSTPDLLEAFGEMELTLSQLKLVHLLERREEPVSVKEAAEMLALSLPAASRAIDDLVRRGLVERHEDQIDRRVKRVSVTAAGRGVIRRLNAARLVRLQEFARTLSDAERDRLGDALALLLRRPQVASCRLQRGDLG